MSHHQSPLPGTRAGSYFESWLRKQGVNVPGPLTSGGGDKSVSERGVYLSFLETQLERTSAAALEVGMLSERVVAQERLIVEQGAALTNLTAKLAQVANAVGLAQAYSERQGEEAGTAVAGLHAGLGELGSRMESRLGALEGALGGTMEEVKALKGSTSTLSKGLQDCTTVCTAQAQSAVDAAVAAGRASDTASRAEGAALGASEDATRALGRVEAALALAEAAKCEAEDATDAAGISEHCARAALHAFLKHTVSSAAAATGVGAAAAEAAGAAAATEADHALLARLGGAGGGGLRGIPPPSHAARRSTTISTTTITTSGGSGAGLASSTSSTAPLGGGAPSSSATTTTTATDATPAARRNAYTVAAEAAAGMVFEQCRVVFEELGGGLRALESLVEGHRTGTLDHVERVHVDLRGHVDGRLEAVLESLASAVNSLDERLEGVRESCRREIAVVDEDLRGYVDGKVEGGVAGVRGEFSASVTAVSRTAKEELSWAIEEAMSRTEARVEGVEASATMVASQMATSVQALGAAVGDIVGAPGGTVLPDGHLRTLRGISGGGAVGGGGGGGGGGMGGGTNLSFRSPSSSYAVSRLEGIGGVGGGDNMPRAAWVQPIEEARTALESLLVGLESRMARESGEVAGASEALGARLDRLESQTHLLTRLGDLTNVWEEVKALKEEMGGLARRLATQDEALATVSGQIVMGSGGGGGNASGRRRAGRHGEVDDFGEEGHLQSTPLYGMGSLSAASARVLVEEVLATKLGDTLAKLQRAASHAVEASTASGTAAAAASEGAASSAKSAAGLTSSLHALEAALESERAARRVGLDELKVKIQGVEVGLKRDIGEVAASLEERLEGVVSAAAGAERRRLESGGGGGGGGGASGSLRNGSGSFSSPRASQHFPASPSSSSSHQHQYQNQHQHQQSTTTAPITSVVSPATSGAESQRIAALEQRLAEMTENMLLLTGEVNLVQTTQNTLHSGGGGELPSNPPSPTRPRSPMDNTPRALSRRFSTASGVPGGGVLSAETLLRSRARGLVADALAATGEEMGMAHARSSSPTSVAGTQTPSEAQVQTEGGGGGGGGGGVGGYSSLSPGYASGSGSSSSSRRAASPLQRSLSAARESLQRRGSSVPPPKRTPSPTQAWDNRVYNQVKR